MDKLFNALSVVSSQDYTLEMRQRGKNKLLYADAEKCHDVFLAPNETTNLLDLFFGGLTLALWIVLSQEQEVGEL